MDAEWNMVASIKYLNFNKFDVHVTCIYFGPASGFITLCLKAAKRLASAHTGSGVR